MQSLNLPTLPGKPNEIDPNSDEAFKALCGAIRSNKDSLVEELFQNCVGIYRESDDGTHIVHVLASTGKCDYLELCLDNFSSEDSEKYQSISSIRDKPNPEGKTPLVLASENGHADVVQLLVNKNAGSIDDAIDVAKTEQIRRILLGKETYKDESSSLSSEDMFAKKHTFCVLI